MRRRQTAGNGPLTAPAHGTGSKAASHCITASTVGEWPRPKCCPIDKNLLAGRLRCMFNIKLRESDILNLLNTQVFPLKKMDFLFFNNALSKS